MAFCYSCMSVLQTDAAVCPVCKSKLPYVPEKMEDLRPGTMLQGGRFIIGRSLGHGGYGISYIAYDTKLEVRRAIKEYFPRGAHRGPDLRPVYPPSEEANVHRTREHFLKEARIMTQACEGQTKGIVQIIDKFDENGTAYILMEYLDGYTVDDYIRKVQVAPLKWEKAVAYTVEALEALQRLHDRNILHRDISCSNIFICRDNSIRLIDFGSAEFLDEAQRNPAVLWKSRKPAYTPREQIDSKPQGTYTDIYAMGVSLFKMIAGNVDRNLDGKRLPSLKGIVRDQDIPPELDRILGDATAEDPRKRIQTADEFRKRLLPLIKPKASPLKKIAIIAAIVAVLGVGGIGVKNYLNYLDEQERLRQEQERIRQEIENQWAEITLATTERQFEVPYGGIWPISGTAEPGQTVELKIKSPGSSEAVTVDTATADDDKGSWMLAFNTGDLSVAINTTETFTANVVYNDSEDHPATSSTMSIVVNREWAKLTIGYDGEEGTRKTSAAGETVIVSGTGQKNEKVIITVSENGEAILSQEATWSGDTWFASLKTGEMAPGTGKLRRSFSISAHYDTLEDTTRTTEALNLEILRNLRDINIRFRDNRDRLTQLDDALTVEGSAEPGEELRVFVGQNLIDNVSVNEDGTWSAVLPTAGDLNYRPGEEVPVTVRAAYIIQTSKQSETLTFTLAIPAEREIIYPQITQFPRQALNEGDTIRFAGTAEPGATLNLRISRADGDNLTPDIRIHANADEAGSWEWEMTTADIPEEREEGSTDVYEVTAIQERDGTELESGVVQIRIFKPIEYPVPTIGFTDSADRSRTVLYTDSVNLSGTARPGEYLNVKVNGETWTSGIHADLKGRWSYRLGDISQYQPELGGTQELEIAIKYAFTDITSQDNVRLTVTNPRYADLTLALAEGGTSRTTGTSGSIGMTVQGEAGRNVEILRNGSECFEGALNGQGTLTFTQDASEYARLTATDYIYFARYTEQTVTRSEQVQITVDRYAEDVIVTERINEETTSISGTAEDGATLVLTIGGQKAGETRAADGSFTFSNLQINAGDVIVITGTDMYGNTTEYRTTATQIPRENFTVTEYSNGASYTYGPNGTTLRLSGTGAAKKMMAWSLTFAGESPQSGTTEIKRDGNWSMKVTLPETESTGTLTLQYEDGRGNTFTLFTSGNFTPATASIEPAELYTRETDQVSLRVSKPVIEVQWELTDGKKTTQRGSGTIQMRNTEGSFTLPENRAKDDILTIHTTDAYGNEGWNSWTINERRDRTQGRIYSVLCGDEDIKDGGKITGNLRVEAYVAAGGDASITTPSIQLVQNGMTVSKADLTEARDDDLTGIQNKIGDQAKEWADRGWRVRGATLSTEYLEEGGCELVLSWGDGSDRRLTWRLTMEDPTGGTAMHYADLAEGWDIGTDAPADAFPHNAIYITGWVYRQYEDTTKEVKSGNLILYEDQRMTTEIATVSSKQIKYKNRRPGTTSCDTDFKSLHGAEIKNAGWIITFKANKRQVPNGIYWAMLDAGGERFGPFRLEIDGGVTAIKQNVFIDSLDWEE